VGSDGLDAFGRRLMNIEVEAAAHAGRTASPTDVERAAARLARRLDPSG
jgi:histone H3/H4